MANEFQNVTSGLAELKNYYQGPIIDQLSEDLPVYRAAKSGQHKWSGQQVIRPLKVRRNQGIGATSDGGTLPAIGRQTTVQAIIQAKYNYLRFGVTGPMIAASQSDVGSFVRAAAYELEQGYNDLKSDVNRQLTWDGTGDLARLNAAAAASTSITIKGREDAEPALKFVDVGLVFDVYDSGGSLVQSGVTVSAISSGGPSDTTATLTVTPALTASADDILVRANSFGQEIQGLLTQLDGGTSTVFNVDRSLYPSTQGNVVDLSAAQLDLDSLQQAQDEAERRGAARLKAIYSDFPSRRMYQKLLTADKRYVNTVEGDGGFASKGEYYLEWNGMPWVADKDCPPRIFMLDDKYIVKYVQKELEFASETGTMYIAQPESDELEVRLRLFANLFNEMASGSAVVTDYVSP
jgi:hypothetical protein